MITVTGKKIQLTINFKKDKKENKQGTMIKSFYSKLTSKCSNPALYLLVSG